MKIFKYIFWTFYRIWFYVLVALPIIVLFPLLLISISKESWYPYFFKLARFWARFILVGMGMPTKINYLQKTERKKSYMFIANHTSMIDIMLMLVAVKNPFVFVGKAELAKIPSEAGTRTEYPLVADVNGDGAAEVIVMSCVSSMSTRASPPVLVAGMVWIPSPTTEFV